LFGPVNHSATLYKRQWLYRKSSSHSLSHSKIVVELERPPVNPEARKTLIKALYGKNTFRYLYDFGDGWDHRIKVEKMLPAVAYPQVPYCVDGAKACPPEDIGGGPGYAEFLEAMADPNHSEHEDMLEWYGSTFNPTVFEWERVNQWLKEIKV
jgi:hypothetical protein